MFAAYESDSSGSQVINPFGALEIEHPTQGRQLRGYAYESMSYFLDLVGALSDGASLPSLQGAYPCAEEAVHSTWIGQAVDESLATRAIVERVL
jgi:hypothetical protein